MGSHGNVTARDFCPPAASEGNSNATTSHPPTATTLTTITLFLHLPLATTTSATVCIYPLCSSYKVISTPSCPASTAGKCIWRIPRAPPLPHPDPDHASSVRGDATHTETAEIETWLIYWSVLSVMQMLETFLGWSWNWWAPFRKPCVFPIPTEHLRLLGGLSGAYVPAVCALT